MSEMGASPESIELGSYSHPDAPNAASTRALVFGSSLGMYDHVPASSDRYARLAAVTAPAEKPPTATRLGSTWSWSALRRTHRTAACVSRCAASIPVRHCAYFACQSAGTGPSCAWS